MVNVMQGCAECVGLLVSPQMQSLWQEQAPKYGPGFSGALFGAGWWFFVDAVVLSSTTSGAHVPGILCLPGVIATIALVMINCIRRDEISGSAYDEGSLCRSKFWLFLSYVVSFISVAIAVWLLIGNSDTDNAWSSVAALFQVCFILASGLMFFLTRTASDEDNYGYF